MIKQLQLYRETYVWLGRQQNYRFSLKGQRKTSKMLRKQIKIQKTPPTMMSLHAMAIFIHFHLKVINTH